MINKKLDLFKNRWIVSCVIGFLLNLFFIYLMCFMIQDNPTKQNEFPTFVGSVDMVKIRPKNDDRTRKEETKKRVIEKNIKKITVNIDNNQKIKKIIPNVPFKVNLKLPVETDIALPKEIVLNPPSNLKGVFSMDDLDTPLIPVVKINPIYPMRARMMGIEGFVKVRFIVNKDGRTRDIKVIDASPKNIFEKPTIDAISRWRFKPPTIDGVPVDVQVEVPIRYKLD